MTRQSTNIRTFKDPTILTEWTKSFLVVSIVFSAFVIMSGFRADHLLNDIERGVYASETQINDALHSNEQKQSFIWWIAIIPHSISFILFLIWIYRANFNVRQLGASGMVFTPGWAIGWWFIPIANFWMPYRAMKEVWKASKNPANWAEQPSSFIITWWWFYMIFSYLWWIVIVKMSLEEVEYITDLLNINEFEMVGELIFIILQLLSLAIISGVHGMQMAIVTKKGNHDAPSPFAPVKQENGQKN